MHEFLEKSLQLSLCSIVTYLPDFPFPGGVAPTNDCHESRALLKEMEVPSMMTVLGLAPQELQQ